jgi:hypothetical protein
MSVLYMVLDIENLKIKSKGHIPPTEFLESINKILREVQE